MIFDQTNTFADYIDYATGSREPFYAIARRYCKKGANVLDVGAGTGEFARPLAYCNVFLIEGNAANVFKLREEFDHVFHHQVPDAFPFDSASFDVIHCSHLVEHLEPHDVYSFMLEVDRCLAPGGHLIISTPLLSDGFYNDLSHVRPYPPHVFINYLCGENGFPRTRAIISKNYRPVELRYRYGRKPVGYLSIFNISPSRRWAQRALFWVIDWLRKRDLSVYHPTGYTLVLQKGHLDFAEPTTT